MSAFEHQAVPCPEGRVRVDLHTHTMYSGDSTTTLEEYADHLERSQIDLVAVTDHGEIEGAMQLRNRLGPSVIVGEEIRTRFGEIIGLFLTERIPTGLPPLETAERIRAQGGAVYIPHPFDPMRAALHTDVLDELVAAGLVDALEVRNGKTRMRGANDRAVEYAEVHGLGRGAGSDAHVPAALGAVVVELPVFDDPGTFLEALIEARVLGGHHDPPRPWTPRIIPSTGPSADRSGHET